MSQLLAGEWIKMTHRWMPRILLLVMTVLVGLILFFVGVVTVSVQQADAFWPRGLLLGLQIMFEFSGLFMTILAGAWAGNEYGWETIRMVLIARPNRIQQFLAGFLIILVFEVGMVLVALFLGLIFCAFGSGSGAPSDFVFILIKGILAVLLSMSFYSLLAYTAGVAFRSVAGGIATGIGVWIVEMIVGSIMIGAAGIARTIAEHFPYQYAEALPGQVMQPAFRGNVINASSTTPTAGAAFIGVVIYSAIVMAIGLFVVSRRDITA